MLADGVKEAFVVLFFASGMRIALEPFVCGLGCCVHCLKLITSSIEIVVINLFTRVDDDVADNLDQD